MPRAEVHPESTRPDDDAKTTAAGGPRRLVVELSRKAAAELNDLVRIEDLNKTTIVNRAVQLYYLIREVQLAGGKVYLQEAGSDQMQRLELL